MSPELARRDILRRRAILVAFGVEADISSWDEFDDLVEDDPHVWSGRALQEVSSTWQIRSCINVSGL